MKKAIATILGCVLSVLCFSSCGNYEHPEFKTKYTIAQHIQRIETRTREKYAVDIESGYIQDFTVDIVYAYYDHDPEYFLIEFSLLEELEDENGNALQWEHSAHLIGYIYQDKYWTGAYGYEETVEDTRKDGEIINEKVHRFSAWVEMPSVWKAVGIENEKKYFGKSQYGVKTESGILSLGNVYTYSKKELYYIDHDLRPAYYDKQKHNCILIYKEKGELFDSPFPAGYEALAYRNWKNWDDDWSESNAEGYSHRAMTNEDLTEYVNGEMRKNKIFTREEEEDNMKGNYMPCKREY